MKVEYCGGGPLDGAEIEIDQCFGLWETIARHKAAGHSYHKIADTATRDTDGVMVLGAVFVYDGPAPWVPEWNGEEGG